MKFKLNVVCLVLLTLAAVPAWALQLGQIQVKSTLDQPLVAVIPLQPKDLTELEGLEVGLGPAGDFTRAGLQITPTDQTLRFNVVTDNNGQKLIVVTSSEAITDPYLDFLVQVNTRQGSLIREFVVLLNPVISSPAPEVEAAPVASAPPGSAAAELPAPSEFPQPKAPPASSTAPVPPPATPQSQSRAGVVHGGSIAVEHGSTLFSIAKAQAVAAHVNIYQMMLALQAANPDAFFKHNVSALKAGAILRIPTRDEIDKVGVATADAEVHRQYDEWQGVKPKPATVVAGAAVEAAAHAQPKPVQSASASDHLALVPPTSGGAGASNRPGIAGGTGTETVTGLQQQLQDARGTLISLNQSNADLASRVKSLQDIAGKSSQLLNMKNATVAQLQRKLAQVQARKPSAKAVASALVKKGIVSAQPTPWYAQPVTWFVLIVVIALIVFRLWAGKYLRRKTDTGSGKGKGKRGPLKVGPADVSAPASAAAPASASASTSTVPLSATPNPGEPGYENWMLAQLAEHPESIEAHLAACRWFYAEGDTRRFLEAADAMRARVDDPGCVEWREVVVMGEEMAPHNALFQAHAQGQTRAQAGADEDPYGLAALRQPARSTATHVADVADDALPAEPASAQPTAQAQHEPDISAEPAYSDDPVDTKLDLARAYLDMGDPVGARAMLEEVLAEGTQMQKDEARRLLAETES